MSTVTAEPGKLLYIGVQKLGLDSYRYWRCSTCRTEFPEINSTIHCNGFTITDCPWCGTHSMRAAEVHGASEPTTNSYLPDCTNGQGRTHEPRHVAEGWMTSPEGKHIVAMCRAEAERVIGIYLDKLGEQWTFETEAES